MLMSQPYWVPRLIGTALLDTVWAACCIRPAFSLSRPFLAKAPQIKEILHHTILWRDSRVRRREGRTGLSLRSHSGIGTICRDRPLFVVVTSGTLGKKTDAYMGGAETFSGFLARQRRSRQQKWVHR
ncbi:hypothetical protein ARMSODRAFT_601807 [Armillaria solidipes]|uniref:Uncharacterized protein n=1 Tax=Armillaria solidipes TaxID=1076256 RepID=A0A2H3AVJ6_9AGAR|nr:hypothetical protein ARMSODRAFT_601807 [Armillaria solidipes]